MKPSMIVAFCLLWVGTSSTAKLFGKHNGKHKKRVYHMDTVKESQESVTKKQSTPSNYLNVTDNGPTGMINVKNPGSSLTAAVGDGTTNDTSAIQAIINHAAGTTKNNVFFPPGEYLVSSDIVIPGSVELHGTEIGIAVIKASTPYVNKVKNSSPVTSVALKNLYFDGILVDFDGGNSGASSTRDITVFQSVFFSTASPSNKNRKRAQLRFRGLTNGDVVKCVFLRDSGAFGVASKFDRTKTVSVLHNVCGLDLNKIDWLSTQLRPAWTEQKQKLEFLKSHYRLVPDQGFFCSCLYDQCDQDMRIKYNVFNGSPNTGSLHKDHAMYLKGFNTMVVERNYVRGWPADLSGGIKARNGINLWLACNYIDDTGILLYSHRKSKTCLYDGLKDVFIYGNHIVQRNNPGGSINLSIIRYYEPHNTGKDENIHYSDNKFEILGVNPNQIRCIWLTNGNLSEHHVYTDNVYFGTNTTVQLQARNATPSSEQNKGSYMSSVLAHYNNCLSYKMNLSIPTY